MYVFKHNLKKYGTDIKIQNIAKRVTIKEYKNAPNQMLDDKVVFSDFLIKQGTILTIADVNYLAIQEETNVNSKVYKCYIRKLHLNIKVYINKVLYTMPCAIEPLQLGTFENNYIKLGQGVLNVMCALPSILPTVETRFIKMGSAWKISGIDTSKAGLLKLTADKDIINHTTDDMVLEIADRWKNEVKHNYTMELDTADIILQQEKTKQLIPIIKDTPPSGAEVVVQNPTIIYTVNNNNCTISNTGLITATNVGNSIITVQFENIIKTININITAKDVITYTYKFKTITVDSVAYVDNTVIEVEQTKTKALKVSEIEKITTKNGSNTSEIITNPSITYKTDNNNISISDVGLITGATVGTSIITISYIATDNTTITKNINVSCKELVLESVNIVAPTSLGLGESATITLSDPEVSTNWSWDYVNVTPDRPVTDWVIVKDYNSKQFKIEILDNYDVIFNSSVTKRIKIVADTYNGKHYSAEIKITKY